MRAGGNDGRIERVVAVAFATDFVDAPACPKEGGGLAAEHDATLAVAAFGQLQVTLDVVLEELADVAGIVEITFLELLRILDAEFLAQQAAALGKAVGFVGLDETDEPLPVRVAFTPQVFGVFSE